MLSITPSTRQTSGGYSVVNYRVYFATFKLYFHDKEVKFNLVLVYSPYLFSKFHGL